ncbi:GNAT family N-acetyltransferase [Chryseobacterium sp. CFS15]|uniref:GNAT family N-acetyltransferase n=1 Tax=Chryseobacterium sp. CFS15 TaxID=2986946 RepID=UPI0028093CD1|nr:GNAT family N-acetyltransferase [Chryseobacterium sp. CFS15]MDQ8141443.1 GNAT family N-acetyltransferase [Chryseobacterium sp. CFS15]
MKEIKDRKIYNVIPLKLKNYEEIATIWEASVRATHNFLKEEDILFFRTLIITEYLPNVQLYGIKINSSIAGFAGIANNKIEMLFVSPERFGKGIGETLLKYVISTYHCTEVDVNEQNTQAANFYKKNGFIIVNKSEIDSTGKSYPILHLQYFSKLS